MKYNEILLICPINKLSYGYASVNILEALSKKIKVALWTIGGVEVENHQVQTVKEALYNAQSFDYDAPSIRIFHQNSLDVYPGRGPKIGFPIFELDTFTPVEKHNLAYPDKLMVCSDWAKSIVKNNLPDLADNTYVIPLGVDPSIFSPSPIQPGPTVFLNIGKLEKRKGHDILIKAFTEEFKSDEKVKLLLCCDNLFLTNEQKEAWGKIIRANKNVYLIPRQESCHDISELIKMSDCGVYPSKAEGWNMPALETLACGRHLIITDYSAHTQYVNEHNSLLIDIDKNELAYDDIWPVFNGQGSWAHIGDKQFKQLKRHMRQVHDWKQNGLPLNEQGCSIPLKFSWENSASKILDVLDSL